jgi:hypothetical protein
VKRSLVIGKTNVGKTLFCIRFAQYMGIKELQWMVEHTDGSTEQNRMSLREAEHILSGPDAHHTRGLQSFAMEFPRGKGYRQLLMTDTTGLAQGIHPDVELRNAMAQTLQVMADAPLLIHVVDASSLGWTGKHAGMETADAWDQLDEQVSRFGVRQPGYLILANKMDLPGAKMGYQRLRQRFTKQRVIPISAMHNMGFREVKQHVWRFA